MAKRRKLVGNYSKVARERAAQLSAKQSEVTISEDVFNTQTATEMALSAHTISIDATYARRPDGSLWIWSDRRQAWVQIDFQEPTK